MKIVFEKIKILIFFLCEIGLPLILKVDRKRKKKRAGNICEGSPDIRFEQDWSVGLGATLRVTQKIKNYLSSFRDFSGKADSVILLGFGCTINPQNLNKIVRAIFEKIEILIFFVVNYP